MSKKSKKKSRGVAAAGPASPGEGGLRRRGYYIAALSALVLVAASAAATRFEPVRRAVGMRPLSAAPAQGGAQLPLSKEYVYAGGRLVATEEPTATPMPTPVGAPPTNFAAAFAPAAGGVTLTWTRPAGSVTGYEVQRRHGLGPADFTTIPVGGNVDTFTDQTGENNASYVYRVRAAFAGGYSDYSGYDLATAVAIGDDPIKSQATVIKAAHLNELRRAVLAVRTLAGKGAPTWTYPDPVSSPASSRRAIYLADVTELHTQLDEALTRLDQALAVQIFQKPYPANPPLAQYGRVYAEHFEQIRARVR
jgi:hypothetical protein